MKQRRRYNGAADEEQWPVIAVAADELAMNAARVDLRLRCEVEAVAQEGIFSRL